MKNLQLEVTSLQKQIDGLQMHSKHMTQEDTVRSPESQMSYKTGEW